LTWKWPLEHNPKIITDLKKTPGCQEITTAVNNSFRKSLSMLTTRKDITRMKSIGAKDMYMNTVKNSNNVHQRFLIGPS
jgi:hypothetical protein